jgi:ABC-type branched-subunit amino acid transport system substrate-binding protein
VRVSKNICIVGILLLVLLAAACSSSSKSSSAKSTAGSAGSGSGKTVTIGVLTDLTGAAASSDKSTIPGVQAGIAWAKDHGYTIKYIAADTATSPTTALTAAQKLVTQDHVLAVVMDTGVGFAAAPYLNKERVPVIGLAADGPEWATDTNMFAVTGVIKENLATTVYGNFFKLEGVTNLASFGYGGDPATSEFAKTVADSAKAAGIKIGYENAQVPLTSTNVEPLALAMNTAKVDGVYGAVASGFFLNLVSSLRQLSTQPKVFLENTGYGQDLEQSGPGAVQSAQGTYVVLSGEPLEMHTAATQQFQKYLQQIGVTGDPGYQTYTGYAAIGMLVEGLKAAGSNPTQASLTAGLSTIHNWDFMGLWGGRTLDINNRADTQNAGGPDNCGWFVKVAGQSFQLVSGAEPLCGPTIPGINETPSA